MPVTDNDEQHWSQLMSKAQQGDEHSYANLLKELGNAIEAYLRSRFGPIDIIEDCVQESLIAIHAARHTYDSQRLFRPWFFAIVRNRTIDLLRNQKSYKTALARNILEHTEKTPLSIEEEVHKSMVFSMLAPAYREVLLLTKVIGFSTSETAEKLGISESAVRVRVHRGIKETRKILQNEQV